MVSPAAELECATCSRRFLWEPGASTSCPHCGSADTLNTYPHDDESEDE